MSNHITIEHSAEDRARLDKLIALLEARVIQAQAELEHKLDKPMDELNERLKNAINPEPAENPKNAQDEPKATDHPTLDPFPEVPTVAEGPSEAEPVKDEPTVSTAELQQLVIALCRAGKKPEVVKVVNAYGVQTVSAIPEDKRGEAYAKLKQLEG